MKAARAVLVVVVTTLLFGDCVGCSRYRRQSAQLHRSSFREKSVDIILFTFQFKRDALDETNAAVARRVVVVVDVV